MDLSWIWRDLWKSLPLPEIDWFWLDFAGYASIVLGIFIVLWLLIRFLPDGVKPIALAIVTGGLTFLWGYWQRHADERKREAAKPKPVPPPKPKDDGGGIFGGWR